MSKKPSARRIPQRSKQVRSAPVSVSGENPKWSFADCDFGGPWCFRGVEGDDARNLVEKLHEFQRMTWAEIEGDRHHFANVSSLARKAQMRLQDIRHDDVDALFSLSLGGKPRLWGIRRQEVFYVLWWDPEHEVCPSHKRNT